MSGFLNDLRFGLRQLMKRPGFTAAAILTLALGIGANTAVFSVLNGYMLKPLPYPQSSQLAEINESFPGAHMLFGRVSVMNYRDIEKHISALAGVAAYARRYYNLTVDGHTQRVTALRARSSLFDVLDAKPYIGHVFGAANDQPGRGNVAVLSYAFWQQAFGGEPGAIGRSMKLNGKPYRIIGVMPRSWNFPDKRVNVLVPYVFSGSLLRQSRESSFPLKVIGRIKLGANVRTVKMQLARFQARVKRKASAPLQAVYKKYGWRVNVRPYKDVAVGDRAPLLLILQGFVLLLLLMACANVANLLLARILGRTHEMAMRAALGASRWMLVRQLFIEGLCLALPGGLAGVALGWLGVSVIRNVGLSARLGVFTLTPDWRVGLFALGVVVLVTTVISLLPIRHLSRTDLQSLLQEGAHGMAGGRGAKRTRNAMVIAEIALAAALLGGTGLLVNSFVRLQAVNPGFNTHRVLTADVLLPSAKRRVQYYGELLRRVRALPGVVQAGLVNNVPIKTPPRIRSYSVPGFSPVGARQPLGNYVRVSPGYFKAMDIAPLRGRVFGPKDKAEGRPVAIIDKKMAETWFPHESPIGHQMTVGGYNTGPEQKGIHFTIVGEVATIHATSLDQAPQNGTYYVNALQWPSGLSGSISIVAKTVVPPYSLTQPLKRIVHQLNPLVSISNFTSLHDVLTQSLQEREAVMVLVLVFACLGLALAAVGVYGVLSYAVGQRTQECGVRLALGAEPKDILWLITRDGLKLLIVGLCSGLGLAVALGFAISSQLFNVAPFDPVTLTGVTVALSIITLVACYLPARRAAKLDPAIAIMEQ